MRPLFHNTQVAHYGSRFLIVFERKKRMTVSRFILFAIGVMLVSSVRAQVTVEDAWVRATVPGQPVAAAYFKIRSARTKHLVAVRTPVTARAEVHEMRLESGIMRMRPVTRLELPAGMTVELKPGGYHLMLMNIAKPLRPGEVVPITLVIEGPDNKPQEIKIDARVRDVTGGMGGHGNGMKH